MSKKIMIVDDEKNIRNMIKDCLDTNEYEVYLAVNGEEAYTKLKDSEYDMALLDIKMPGMTGLELLRKLREENINIPVVMMTAYGNVERAVEAMKLGAIDFISKPFSPTEIRDIVNEVTRRSTVTEDKIETYRDMIDYAKTCIISREYAKAGKYLSKAVSMKSDSPEPFNLMGVIEEMQGDTIKAQNHYRAALALNPNYKPAENNLTRTVIDGRENDKIDLGN